MVEESIHEPCPLATAIVHFRPDGLCLAVRVSVRLRPGMRGRRDRTDRHRYVPAVRLSARGVAAPRVVLTAKGHRHVVAAVAHCGYVPDFVDPGWILPRLDH